MTNSPTSVSTVWVSDRFNSLLESLASSLTGSGAFVVRVRGCRACCSSDEVVEQVCSGGSGEGSGAGDLC